MASTTEIKIDISESILLSLKKSKHDFIKELLLNNAVMLYKANKLSLGKAAELAGYSRMDFIWKLNDLAEPIFEYEEDLIVEMAKNAEHALKIIEKGG